LFTKGQIPLRYSAGEQVADLRVRVAGRSKAATNRSATRF